MLTEKNFTLKRVIELDFGLEEAKKQTYIISQETERLTVEANFLQQRTREKKTQSSPTQKFQNRY